MNTYGLRYRMVQGNLIATKTREFKTDEERTLFLALISKSDSFWDVVTFSDPTEEN